jgi:hypothetical protein
MKTLDITKTSRGVQIAVGIVVAFMMYVVLNSATTPVEESPGYQVAKCEVLNERMYEHATDPSVSDAQFKAWLDEYTAAGCEELANG